MLTIAVSCLGLPAPVLAEPELADSRSVRDGATGFIDEVLGLADDAPLCASPSPPPLSPSPSSTVTLIPDTLESTSLEVCASPGGLTVFSEATLYLSSSTSVGFEIDGTVSANGASALTMSAGSEEEPWVPLPDLLPDFTMPALAGEPHQNQLPSPLSPPHLRTPPDALAGPTATLVPLPAVVLPWTRATPRPHRGAHARRRRRRVLRAHRYGRRRLFHRRRDFLRGMDRQPRSDSARQECRG